jgi:23S rRNA (uracil1939-C5)-methyltransferase
MSETIEPRRPRPGEIVTGTVVDLAFGGAGVIKHHKWVIMARGAFPGETVKVRIARRRKGILEADLTEVIEPSPDRVPTRCPHLSICGGCALQGLSPEAQTRFKSEQAVQLLKRIGKFEPNTVGDPWQSPSPWYYRNKMEFTFAARPWLPLDELVAGVPFTHGVALGLHPRGVFQGVFNIEDCRLQSQISNRIVEHVRQLAVQFELPVFHSRKDEGMLRHLVIRQAATSDDLVVILVVRREDPRLSELAVELKRLVPEITGIVASINLRISPVAQGDYDITLLGEPYWHERVLGIDFRIGASSFFQTQTKGGEALLEEVMAIGEFGPDQTVLDLYCGIGAFSLPIARQVGRLCGVEVLPAAVIEAQHNAATNGITNAEFFASPVESKETLPWEAGAPGETPRPWDTIVIDPPRSGLHPKALAKVRAIAAPTIIYVSCNPSTLARDAEILVNEDGYRPERLRVFDIFPQTPHLESVLLLRR